MMSRRRAPSDLRMPISRVRCGDGDEHDVHDHDRAHDEPDGGQHHAGEHEILLDLVSHARARSRALEHEVVLVRRVEPVAPAHDLAHHFLQRRISAGVGDWMTTP